MYKAIKPKESNGWAEVVTMDNKSICVCYADGLKKARRIAKALNKLEKKEKSPK